MRSSVELFTGCGGLAMGLARAGFRARRMVEWDRHSVENVAHNRTLGLEHVRDWPIERRDVREVDWRAQAGLDLVAGGPPCQPFSIGGKHRGQEDRRDMWPEAVRAIREIAPRGFLFENVRGLARAAFADYLRWVMAALAHPDVPLLEGESRVAHLARLGRAGPARYRLRMLRVNAADFGAAQKRHRIILLGLRADLGAEPPQLLASHSRERLIWDQWVSGEYWARHGMTVPAAGPDRLDAGLARRLRAEGRAPETRAWRTVRDALADLGEPGAEDARPGLANHVLRPGARAYPGHTGSPLDMPAKALKAGVHGVPGGENMLAFPDGRLRYLSVREAARLQGMPDDFEFIGSWTENMRQLGNAVPTELAEAAARAMAAVLDTGGGAAGRRPEVDPEVDPEVEPEAGVAERVRGGAIGAIGAIGMRAVIGPGNAGPGIGAGGAANPEPERDGAEAGAGSALPGRLLPDGPAPDLAADCGASPATALQENGGAATGKTRAA